MKKKKAKPKGRVRAKPARPRKMKNQTDRFVEEVLAEVNTTITNITLFLDRHKICRDDLVALSVRTGKDGDGRLVFYPPRRGGKDMPDKARRAALDAVIKYYKSLVRTDF